MKLHILRTAALLIALFGFFGAVYAQTPNPNLAKQYYLNGEYEKAGELYAQLIENGRGLADV